MQFTAVPEHQTALSTWATLGCSPEHQAAPRHQLLQPRGPQNLTNPANLAHLPNPANLAHSQESKDQLQGQVRAMDKARGGGVPLAGAHLTEREERERETSSLVGEEKYRVHVAGEGNPAILESCSTTESDSAARAQEKVGGLGLWDAGLLDFRCRCAWAGIPS